MNKIKKASGAVLLSLVLVGNVSAAQSKNDIKIEINGKEVVSDVSPFIDNDRTLVPIRVISENLGYNVDWNNQDRKVIVKNNDKSIELVIGDKNVNVNGNKSTIDVAPMIKDERTFVPLRFIAENFDNNVNWDKDTRTVKIDKKESKKVASIVNTKDTDNNKKKIPTLNNTFTPVASKPIVETKVIREPQIIYVYKDKETTPSKNTTQRNETKPTTKPINNKENNTPVQPIKPPKEDNHEDTWAMDSKPFQVENVERNLQYIKSELKNLSATNFRIKQEQQNYAQFKQGQPTDEYPDSVRSKIRKIEDDYDVVRQQDLLTNNNNCITFTQTKYDELSKSLENLKNSSTAKELNNAKKECNDIMSNYINGLSNINNNDRLRQNIKRRKCVKDILILLYADGIDDNRYDIYNRKRELINIDSSIISDREPDTQFTIAPDVQKLLDEYDKELKEDIANNYNFSK